MATRATGRGRGGNRQRVVRVTRPADPGEPPKGDLEAKWWAAIWGAGREWLPQSSVPLVRMTAEALAERDRLRAWLASQPVTARWYETGFGQINPHPAVTQLRSLEAQLLAWFGTMGFTPQAFAAMKLGEDETAQAFDDLRQLREAKRAG